MQLEQEYEEKQMVVHEKHDLEGLIATLCDQVRHRRHTKRSVISTHALIQIGVQRIRMHVIEVQLL